MPSRGHRKNFRSYHKLQSRSPFFDLPPEVRNLIYRHALVYHKPIDLCPPSYNDDPHVMKANPALAARLAKHDQEHEEALAMYEVNVSCHRTTRWDSKPTKPILVFRNQKDLAHLRAQMCVALLATCAQAYNEGSAYFWSENTFRFTDDPKWNILYRFLLTIGPVARSRLKHVQVMAPFAEQREGGYLHLAAKNDPKLHMAYVRKGKDNGRIGDGCMAAVFDLMRAENLWRLCVEMTIAKNQEPVMNFDGNLWVSRTAHLYTFKKVVVVVESGAYMRQAALDTILEYGLDVKCERGTIFDRSGEQESLDLVLTLRSSETDEFIGVPNLFLEPEEERHARGGKANKSAGPIKTARVLKGFGGCRFILKRDIWGQETVEMKHKTRYRRMNELNF